MTKKTTDKGLGRRHQAAVDYLKQKHRDGSPCDWCGKPMYLDPTKNPDYDWSAPGRRGNGVLQGDHSVVSRSESLRRGEPVLPPDRLLHAECNRQRGAGLNDHLAAVNRSSVKPLLPVSESPARAMPWPWAD
ncbi:hypothetical protein FHT44_005108 [Mycolicibacterium sp. BK634]|uniref:hypothetical protein n=1 Tax=Mycolicibacterium sp. BK634 TaxID=2587099 RepID=UPI0017B8FC0F|nr:hypothetical protein [Mycolicibacterium sp. BK634]MBB3752596.1 hypothetical protein [Mycolicibacterium sp. BK634]